MDACRTAGHYGGGVAVSLMLNRCRRSRLGDDRGVTLIMAAFCLFVMMGFAAFVVDMGVLWLARGAAQNAADAGALAAGTALVYDNFDDRADSGPAHQSGLLVAQSNGIIGTPANAVVQQNKAATGWTPTAPQTCLDAPGSCVQVSIYRDGTNGSGTLPTYFANIFGQQSQAVRATATAQLRAGNGSSCLKPWFAPDKSETTTYGLSDVGTLLILRANAGPSSYAQAEFNRSGASCGGTGPCYIDAVTSCVAKASDGVFKVGDVIQEKPGGFTGPVRTAHHDIYDQDPTATWNSTTHTVQNSCAETRSCSCANAQGNGCANGLNGLISPRIIAIGLYLPSDLAIINSPGTDEAPIHNIAGAFLLEPGTGPDPQCSSDPNNMCGYLVPSPGVISSGSTPVQGNTLNVFVSLIR
jgi:hypothetical protein